MLPTPRAAFWERVDRLKDQGWQVIDERDDPPRTRLYRRVALPRSRTTSASDPRTYRDECLELRFMAQGEFQCGPVPCDRDPLDGESRAGDVAQLDRG